MVEEKLPEGNQPGPTGAASGVVRPLGLRKMASAIAASYGDEGAIVISVGKEGVRIGVEGLTPEQIEHALCVAIHYNLSFSSETTS